MQPLVTSYATIETDYRRHLLTDSMAAARRGRTRRALKSILRLAYHETPREG